MKSLLIVLDIVARIPIIRLRLYKFTIQAYELDPHASLIAMPWTYAVLQYTTFKFQHAGLSLHFLKLFAHVLKTSKSFTFAFLDIMILPLIQSHDFQNCPA